LDETLESCHASPRSNPSRQLLVAQGWMAYGWMLLPDPSSNPGSPTKQILTLKHDLG
jgi:hypothetical protein